MHRSHNRHPSSNQCKDWKSGAQDDHAPVVKQEEESQAKIDRVPEGFASENTQIVGAVPWVPKGDFKGSNGEEVQNAKTVDPSSTQSKIEAGVTNVTNSLK